jgi:fumarate hydratase class II
MSPLFCRSAVLLPALELLHRTIQNKQEQYRTVVKTGRTHLMDAMPVTLEQEMSGWAAQVDNSRRRIESTLPRLSELAIGGTAVGTGINTPPGFGARVAQRISKLTKSDFREAPNILRRRQHRMPLLNFQVNSGPIHKSHEDCNDLRWMNSGPVAGCRNPASVPAARIFHDARENKPCNT